MRKDTKLLNQIHEELKKIKFWVRLSGLPSLRIAVNEYLRDDLDKLVYHLSDGNRSTREIADELKKKGEKISHATVGNMWRKWANAGLVLPSSKFKGRYAKAVSLESLGIDVPTVRERGEIHE